MPVNQNVVTNPAPTKIMKSDSVSRVVAPTAMATNSNNSGSSPLKKSRLAEAMLARPSAVTEMDMNLNNYNFRPEGQSMEVENSSFPQPLRLESQIIDLDGSSEDEEDDYVISFT